MLYGISIALKASSDILKSTHLRIHTDIQFQLQLLGWNPLPFGMRRSKTQLQNDYSLPDSILFASNKWTHWDSNPGPSAYRADVIPLHHVPGGDSEIRIEEV